MVFIVIMRNYFNFSRIMTQFVSISKNLYLALVFSRLLGIISPSHPRFEVCKGGSVRVFYFAARYPGGGSSPYHATGCDSTYSSSSDLYCLLPVSELLHQLLEPFLLVGDFNIRHPSWGDTVASPNAAMLFSVISDFSLCCLNSGLPTHYHRSTD